MKIKEKKINEISENLINLENIIKNKDIKIQNVIKEKNNEIKKISENFKIKEKLIKEKNNEIEKISKNLKNKKKNFSKHIKKVIFNSEFNKLNTISLPRTNKQQ